MIKIIEITQVTDDLAQMVALFRVELSLIKASYRSRMWKRAGKKWKNTLLLDSLCSPLWKKGQYAGYVVCRIDIEVVWVESIFVKEEYRRHGVASALHSKKEYHTITA